MSAAVGLPSIKNVEKITRERESIIFELDGKRKWSIETTAVGGCLLNFNDSGIDNTGLWLLIKL